MSIETTLGEWVKSLELEGIYVKNWVTSSKPSACINFISVPHTSVVAMTLTILKDRSKHVALSTNNYAKILSFLEKTLEDIQGVYENTQETYQKSGLLNKRYPAASELFFKSTREYMKTQQCNTLGCHRVFFLPDNTALWLTIEHLFLQKHIEYLTLNGLHEISVVCTTPEWEFKAKFY